MTKEEYFRRIIALRKLLDSMVLSLDEYVDAINKTQREFYSQQVLEVLNPCSEISLPTVKESIDDILAYETIRNRWPHYDSKNNCYKLLLKPLN